jgi:hypothetical protein
MDAVLVNELQENQTTMLISCISEGIGFAALFALIKTQKSNSCNGWL